MNDAKQATPAAELERQICSATEPKNEREWWAHREIERLRDRLSVETLALVETLARAEKAEAERDVAMAESVKYAKLYGYEQAKASASSQAGKCCPCSACALSLAPI